MLIVRFAAPAAVSKVMVSNSGRSDALYVSWIPAEGVVDSYQVQLQDGKRIVHMLVVSSSSPPECSFSSLEAGRLYTVVIVTRSSGLENTTVVQARTRKSFLDVFTCFVGYFCLFLVYQSPFGSLILQNQQPWETQTLFMLERTTTSR